MIEVAGDYWGTAQEIADHIGGGLTAAAVRRWADRDGLTGHPGKRDGRTVVWFPLAQAQAIDKAKRHSKRGRPRTEAI